MKKSLLFAFACSALALVACGNPQTPTSSSPASSTPSATSSTVKPSTPASSEPPKVSSSEEPSSEQPPIVLDGTDVFWCEGIVAGGETDAAAHPGKIYYWAGDGGQVYAFEENKNGELVLEYMASTWAWYGVQVFYKAPYAAGGDTYSIRLNLNSDAAGEVTINGQIVELKRGDNVVVLQNQKRGNEGVDAPVTISMQLGTPDRDSYVWTALSGSVLKFQSIEVFDAVNTYHQVSFTSGENVVKSIQVREGKTVNAPVVAAPEGKVLEGWYDGETKFDPAAPITAPHAFVAKFVDKSAVTAHNITVKNGDQTVAVVEGYEGLAVDLSNLAAPFGYKVDGYYTDAALTTPFDGSAGITSDITIYGKYRVNPVFWINSEEAGWTFHDEIGYASDGGLVLTFNGWGGEYAYYVQVNFSLPVGDAGKEYVVSFDYRINRAGGTYKIYDSEWGYGTPSVDLEVKDTFTSGSVEYPGATLQDQKKLTFELGLIPQGDDPVVFELTNVKFAEKAAA